MIAGCWIKIRSGLGSVHSSTLCGPAGPRTCPNICLSLTRPSLGVVKHDMGSSTDPEIGCRIALLLEHKAPIICTRPVCARSRSASHVYPGDCVAAIACGNSVHRVRVTLHGVQVSTHRVASEIHQWGRCRGQLAACEDILGGWSCTGAQPPRVAPMEERALFARLDDRLHNQYQDLFDRPARRGHLPLPTAVPVARCAA